MRIAAPLLLFLMACSLYAQTNCPTPDNSAPIPLALVSSPLIRVRPPLSQSVLKLPTTIHVYVRATLKPSRVELWTGPTGTEVAEFYCRLASDDRPVLTRKYMKFSFALTSCKLPLGTARVRSGQKQPLSVYKGPFECSEQKGK
jgi:hypothetical protein